MTPAQLALARARTAALLARLLLDGFTDDTASMVGALPALANALPDLSNDEVAARYHRVLILGVPPFESLFLGESATLGGASAGEAADTWAAIGMKVVRHDVEADHFGLSLRALGLLCAAEHDALRDGVSTDQLVSLQNRVVCTRLLPSWPAFHVAVRRLGCSEWTAVVELVGALLEDLVARRDLVPAVVPVPDDQVDDLVTVLLTPSRGGWWLTAERIRELGAEQGMPVGFGARRRTMKNLIEGAAGHGGLGGLGLVLLAELDAWEASLGTVPGGGVWAARLDGARAVVQGMIEAVQRG